MEGVVQVEPGEVGVEVYSGQICGGGRTVNSGAPALVRGFKRPEGLGLGPSRWVIEVDGRRIQYGGRGA